MPFFTPFGGIIVAHVCAHILRQVNSPACGICAFFIFRERKTFFVMKARHLFGREIITCDEIEIDDSNIVEIIDMVMSKHEKNQSEIQYLWDYYKGKQPVIYREKIQRPDICNRIVENRANEIVSFKVGYLCGEPIQYIGRSGDEVKSKAISELNELMFSENKASEDKKIVEWQSICGTAYRLILPDIRGGEDDAPFELYTLDPRYTFVVYSNRIGRKPLFSVQYSIGEKNDYIFSVYTKTHFWEIRNKDIVRSEGNPMGMLPVIEYPANNARLGAFEIVLPLLDAINSLESNRLDAIEQFVQSYWKFVGCDIDMNKFEEFKQKGAIMVPANDNGSNIDVDLIVKEMNQSQTQTVKDDYYNAVLTICGMPNRNGGSSTSDTGQAVILRDGWTLAESRAKDSETIFKESEQEMLKVCLRIIRDTKGLSDELYQLRLKDIEMQFTRRNYENIQSKAQVLDTMLRNPKIHPRLAFESAGMFVDPERAFAISKPYIDAASANENENDNTLINT